MTWTFGRRLGAGFGLMVALNVLLGGIAVYALSRVVSETDQVIRVNARMVQLSSEFATTLESSVAANRAFLLSGSSRFGVAQRDADAEAEASLASLRSLAVAADERAALDRVAAAYRGWSGASAEVRAERRSDADTQRVAALFEAQVVPRRDELRRELDALTSLERERLGAAHAAASASAHAAQLALGAGVSIAALLALLLGSLLTTMLSRQVGTAVQRIESSSAELQAAAGQQASSAKEQATAMREISTTVAELLASSRQIAETATQVSHTAATTAQTAGEGQAAVDRSRAAVDAIRAQMDVVVSHMLELGRKSQQIGAVVEIVAELAEQTNILAINATIEAAGAGDAGKRFAVVAEEIRRLADRVQGSTKEIRTLVDDVRGAVNHTVMASETGSKAVDVGGRQTSDLAGVFDGIVESVETTTDAAKEIELSTRQQTTAVEQVNIAVSSVAQTTRETEASVSQTLATVSELSALSRDLLRLVSSEGPGRA